MNFSFPIIDPHIHQWDLLNTPRILTWPKRLLGWNRRIYEAAIHLGASEADKRYIGRPEFVAHNYLPGDYRNDAEGLPVSHIVHVEAEWRDRSGLGAAGETRWLAGLFEHSVIQLGGVVGYVQLQRSDAAQVIAAHKQASERFCGVRQMLAFDQDEGIMRFCPRPYLSKDESWRRGLSLLEQNQLSFDAWLFHHQLDELVALAKSYPGITFVLDHMGTPIGVGGQFSSYGRTAEARHVILKTWEMHMLALAELPNVVVKLSGMFMPVVGWGFEHRDVPPSQQELLEKAGPLFEFVLKHFGVDRCMFASNFPMDKVSLTLRQLYEFYSSLVENYPEESRKKLFHDNAARVYRVGVSV
ncbi:MAG: amidohydrolase family protein [Ketobacter sp.]|nr:amidohydrolase family protein [Ketobacter sp.]